MSHLALGSKAQKAFYIFLQISVAFLLLYSILDYTLVLGSGYINIKEDWYMIWLPFGLPWIPLFIWLRPQLKKLQYKRKKGDPVFAILFIAAMAISAPTIIAQKYISTASGKLTSLRSIEQIDSLPSTKYYTLASHRIDKEQKAVYYALSVSGKYNQYLDLKLYIACPIDGEMPKIEEPPTEDKSESSESISSDTFLPRNLLILINGVKASRRELVAIPKDSIQAITVLKGKQAIASYGATAIHGTLIVTTKNFQPVKIDVETDSVPPIDVTNDRVSPPAAWVCIRYYKQISNRGEQSEKESKEDAFYQQSMDNFQSRELDSFTYLDRTANNSDRDHYIKAITRRFPFLSSHQLVILEPRFTPFGERNGSSFPWIFGAYLIGCFMVWLFLLLTPVKELDNEIEPDNNIKEEPIAKKKFNTWLPHEGFFVTPWIVYINLAVFALMVFSGKGLVSIQGADLLDWGANFRPLTNHQWWRLISYAFLHGGIMHLLLNMYGLVFGGLFLEPVIGKKRLLVSYLICAVIAGLASISWYPATISVGASGAIFGLYGIFIALLFCNIFPSALKKIFLVNLGIFVGVNLLTGLTGGIDNAAHIGGLLSGLLFGFLMAGKIRRELTEKQDSSSAFNKNPVH